MAPTRPNPASYTISLDHIKMMRNLHLTRLYFEQIITVGKKDKLKTIIVVPATMDAYMDLDELKLDINSENHKFTCRWSGFQKSILFWIPGRFMDLNTLGSAFQLMPILKLSRYP